jgi:hypothetical protein
MSPRTNRSGRLARSAPAGLGSALVTGTEMVEVGAGAVLLFFVGVGVGVGPGFGGADVVRASGAATSGTVSAGAQPVRTAETPRAASQIVARRPRLR